jgi:hypothetical protein
MTTNTEQFDNALAYLRHAERAAHEAKLAIKALDSWEPMRGSEFKVIRGRKFPIGMVARADFIGTNDFGQYVRFTHDGQTAFIAARNVEWPDYIIRHEAAMTAMNKAEEQVREARKTVVTFAGIDLSKAKERGKLSQMAYSDSYVADYDCNPDAPDAILRAALDILDPPQSSWGALRWSQGSSIQSRNGGTVTIASYTGICD